MKKLNILIKMSMFTFLLVFALSLFDSKDVYAEDHDHDFEALSGCSTCGKDGKTDSSCSGCGGDGECTSSVSLGGTYQGNAYTNYTIREGCPSCGGSGKAYYYYYKSVGVSTLVGTSGTYTAGSGINKNSVTCTKCNGYGKNTICQYSYCLQNYDASYDHWTSESDYSSVCYQTFTITYNANGGSGAPSSQSYTYDSRNNKVTISSTKPTRTGYTFKGWGTSKSDTSVDYSAGGTFKASKKKNLSLYAIWEANTLKVYYDANGGTISSSNKTYKLNDKDVILKQSDGTKFYKKFTYNTADNLTYASTFGISRTGYSFTGWHRDGETTLFYTTVDGVKQTYEPTEINENIKTGSCYTYMYATWSANKYTISYNANGGSGAPASQTYTYSTSGTVTLSDDEPTRTGYTFLGWSKSSTATSATYSAEDSFPKDTASNTTLYAVWRKNILRVSYDANGGTINSDIYTMADDGTIKKGGSTFYKLFYYDDADNLTYASTFGLSRTGYKFTGWHRDGETTLFYTTIDGVKQTYKPTEIRSDITKGDKYRTMYATWSAREYTVTFDPGKGTCDEENKKVTYDDTYGTLPTPKRTGYTFSGWYYGTTKVTSTTVANLVASNHELTAKWTKKQYTVTYNANGGTIAGTTNTTQKTKFYYNTEIDLSVQATKSGKGFIGWALTKDATSPINAKKMPASNLTLYAVYIEPMSNMKAAYLWAWDPDDPNDTLKIYDMTMTSSDNIIFNCEIENLNLKSDFGLTNYNNADTAISKGALGLQIVLIDNAGNVTKIPIAGSDETDTPDLNYYTITERHLLIDPVTGEYDFIKDVVHTSVLEGTTFKVSYLPTTDKDYPYDAYNSSKSSNFEVTGSKMVYCYYRMNPHTLYFHCDPDDYTAAKPEELSFSSTTPVYYRKNVNLANAPTVVRQGFEFLGWYRLQDGEEIDTYPVDSSKLETNTYPTDQYWTNKDDTVYPKFKRKKYKVIYDAETNGGVIDGTSYGTVEEQEWFNYQVDLDAYAGDKDGWTFIGWNTNPDAKTALSTVYANYNYFVDETVTLYAIYSKKITVTYIDYNATAVETRTREKTIYNRATDVTFTILNQRDRNYWTSMGWTTGTSATAAVEYSNDSKVAFSEDTTLYGRYWRYVNLYYDTNGADEEIDTVQKMRYYNASGNATTVSFTIANGPTREGYSFVQWEHWTDSSDPETMNKSFDPGDTLQTNVNYTLHAAWDKYPSIEAYDRYFTLEDAQNGNITEEELYNKVVGTDEEDGTLVNGEAVTIPYYQESDFTSFTTDGSVTVTYVATDSFGNSVTKTVTVYIVDTLNMDAYTQSYIRFISKSFHKYSDGSYVPTNKGGLESNSKWITNEAYAETLETVLAYTKDDMDTKIFDFYGTEREIPIITSGEWTNVEATWNIDRTSLTEIRNFVSEKGYGKYLALDAIIDFYERFEDCVE